MFDFAAAPATAILLAVNVVVSLYVLYVNPNAVSRLALVPYDVINNRAFERLFTAGFVHGGIGHLLFNMLTLYFFGPLLEGVLGPGRFLLLYFGSEMAANALSVVMHRRNPNYAAVGASGAISGVVFAFCLFAPFAKLYIFFAIPMPAIVFAVLYVVGSIYAMKQGREAGWAGGIAHEAHLGGALGGLVLTILLEPASLSIFLQQMGLGS